jgi:hypothetical protein
VLDEDGNLTDVVRIFLESGHFEDLEIDRRIALKRKIKEINLS